LAVFLSAALSAYYYFYALRLKEFRGKAKAKIQKCLADESSIETLD